MVDAREETRLVGAHPLGHMASCPGEFYVIWTQLQSSERTELS